MSSLAAQSGRECAHTAALTWAVDSTTVSVEACEALLDGEERSRLACYTDQADRRVAAVTRAALRCVLGTMADTDPRVFRIGRGAWGKPFIVAPLSHAAIQFSVAHAGPVAIGAAVLGRRVGVDVERRRRIEDWQSVATAVFGADIAAQLARIDPDIRDDAFLRCWTAAEAFAKATGLGLAGFGTAIPLRADDPHLEWVRIAGGPPPAQGMQWSVVPLALGGELIGCMVVESPPDEVWLESVATTFAWQGSARLT